MEPENFGFVGWTMLSAGAAMVVIGAFLFGEVYFCAVSSTTCPLSATDAAARVGYALPILLLGSILIIPGAIFAAAGHIAEHFRPTDFSEEKTQEGGSSKQPLRVCVKCGRQVDPSASYCPSCGNQLSKP